MKALPLALVTLATLLATSAHAQVKRGGGIFGFGRETEQLSSGLFPDGSNYANQHDPESPAPRTSENIFRQGEPEKVEAVSYVIENGQKVEQEVEPKKKGFLGFGGREKAEETVEAEAAAPAPTYPDPRNPGARAMSSDPGPVDTAAAPLEESDAIQSQPVEEKKEKSGGFFGFFRKDEKEPEPAAMPEEIPVAAPQPTVAEVAKPRETPAPAPKPVSQPKPESRPEPAAETPADTAPVPEFAGVEPENMPSEEKEKKGLSMPNLASLPSIPNPIPKIRPPRKEKPVDMTGAETIIENGEIVQEEEDIVDTNIVSSGDGSREPPRVVNGVTTYSSWDDVEARSVSAADKILNSIR